jgi:hypothetical protein
VDRLTKEEIETIRRTGVSDLYEGDVDALCDLALQSLSQEAVRDEYARGLQYALDVVLDTDEQSECGDELIMIADAIREELALKREPNATARARPEFDGFIRFESDCVVNGVAVKAGTSWGPFEKSRDIDKTNPAPASVVKRLRVPVSHYDCEDCWYSCATLCCDEHRRSDKCDCGADEENALRSEAAALLARLGQRWIPVSTQGSDAIALIALLSQTPPIMRWKEYEDQGEERIPCFIAVETAKAIAEFFPPVPGASDE